MLCRKATRLFPPVGTPLQTFMHGPAELQNASTSTGVSVFQPTSADGGIVWTSPSAQPVAHNGSRERTRIEVVVAHRGRQARSPLSIGPIYFQLSLLKLGVLLSKLQALRRIARNHSERNPTKAACSQCGRNLSNLFRSTRLYHCQDSVTGSHTVN